MEVKVTKVEARLEVLRGAGIDINKWLQKAGDNHKNDQLQPSTLCESFLLKSVHACCLSIRQCTELDLSNCYTIWPCMVLKYVVS